MITRQDIINAYRKYKNDESVALYLNESEDALMSRETGQYVCTVTEFLATMRKRNHCDFEVLYSEHASLDVVYRCKECGTVIFSGDDERYDPAIECPVCGQYHMSHENFWTQEQIDQDPAKQAKLQAFADVTRMMEEAAKRRAKRHGLSDWQLLVRNWYFKTISVHLEFTREYGHRNPIHGLAMHLSFGQKEKDALGYVINKRIYIPMSWNAFYIRYIYPYAKKCHPDFRKKLPWQNNTI